VENGTAQAPPLTSEYLAQEAVWHLFDPTHIKLLVFEKTQ
jgi:hypothetical protein